MTGLVDLRDRHGNRLMFCHGGDIWTPPYEISDYRGHLQALRHMQLRDDDIILAGFPRSGNHWHYQILRMLQQGSTHYVGTLSDDLVDMVSQEKLSPPDKPRLLVSHLRFHHLPQQVREKKVKVIYLYRNPKDTWVSLFNLMKGLRNKRMFDGTWPQFFDLMIEMGMWYGDWFDHVLDWEKEMAERPYIFPSCFETLKRDPVGQIMKLDEFLGLNRGRALCEQIAAACEFSTLKAAKEAQVSDAVRNGMWKEGKIGFYRKGDIGDWKNWFTVTQNEQFDTVYKKRMSGSKLPFTFV